MKADLCPLCKGKGMIVVPIQTPCIYPTPHTSGNKPNERICHMCKGKGFVEVSGNKFGFQNQGEKK